MAGRQDVFIHGGDPGARIAVATGGVGAARPGGSRRSPGRTPGAAVYIANLTRVTAVVFMLMGPAPPTSILPS